MRFVADMGAPKAVILWLRAQGHDAKSLAEEKLHRLSDPAILALARAEQRSNVTFDTDFGALALANRGEVVSIVLFRLEYPTPGLIVRRLGVVLAEEEDALQRGAIVIVEETRFRVRMLAQED